MNKEKAIEVSKETEKLTLEGLAYNKAIVLATRIFNKSYKNILAPNEDIDNHIVFDIESGETIRELI